MIKTNIKMVVAPDESKQVQEICFANGIGWKSGSKKVLLEHKQYLLIRDYISYDDRERYFGKNLEEVDASLFIRTNGTCVETQPEEVVEVKPTEQKPKQYLCYVQGKALPKHIHKTLEQAKQEAQRLCRKELAKVSVLEVLVEYEAEVVVIEL